MKDKAKNYFECSDRDRALFEAGIKMGTIYHQFVGIPVNRTSVDSVERAIEESVKVQPFVEKADVSIDVKRMTEAKGMYGYTTLTGNLLDVRVNIIYDGYSVIARMKHVEELDYPLMFVESVEKVGKTPDKPLKD